MSFLDPTTPSSTPIANASSSAPAAPLPPVIDAVTGISRAPMGLRRTMTLSHDPATMAGLHLAATGTWNSATDRYDPAPLSTYTVALDQEPDYEAIVADTRAPRLGPGTTALGPGTTALGPAPSAMPTLTRAPSAMPVLTRAPSAMGTLLNSVPSPLPPLTRTPSRWPSAFD